MDAARIIGGLFVAALLANTLPVVRNSIYAKTCLTVSYSLWILLPVLPILQSFALVAIAILWSWIMQVREHKNPDSNVRSFADIFRKAIGSTSGKTWKMQSLVIRFGVIARSSRRTIIAILLVPLTALFLSLDFTLSGINETIHQIIASDRLAIVMSGALAAIFISHEPVARIYSYFDDSAPKSRQDIYAFHDTYGYIGWCERAIVFAFVASGQSGAAALAIAAKSLARHPKTEVDPEFGSKFIMGTFVSVLFAIVSAIAVRLTLGLSPM